MKKIIALFALLLTNTILLAQLPANAWARSFAGTSSNVSDGRGVVVDGSGNVYSTGSFQGTVDFDPGIATYTLASNGGSDVYVTKLDASGNFVWARSLGGGSGDNGYGIALDASGNVIVCGSFYGSGVDFDPGAGTALMNATGATDAFAWKLSGAGNYLAAYIVGGSSPDVANAVAADASGNIYFTGSVQSTVDLDPTAGTQSYAATGGTDNFIIKMGPSNNFLWGKGFGGTGDEAANSIALDGTTSVIITGYYESTADFDPTASTVNLVSTGYKDAFIAKYSSAGALNWAETIGSSTGNDMGTGVVLDPLTNICAVGNFAGTVDLDPSAGTNTVSSNSGTVDFYVVKLASSGGPVWGKSIGGTQPDYAYGITVDSYSDVYVCGNYGSVVDFDPNAGVANLGVNGNTDFFVAKLISNGSYGWAKGIGGSLTEIAYAITVDPSKNLYTTGNFMSLTDFDPNLLTYTLTTAASTTDAFVQKMSLCPTVNAIITGTNVLCYGGSTGSMQVNVTGGTTFTYSWTPFIGTAAFQPNRPAGTYTCLVTNDCYNTDVSTYTITQPPALTSSNSGNVTICQGLSSNLSVTPSGGITPYTYTWTPGATLSSTNIANPIATPGTSTNYNYTVKDNNGCSTAGSLSVTVNAAPSVNISPASINVCAGSSASFTASGATTYSWSTGATSTTISVSPASTTVYTVTGTTAGCAGTKTITVTVNPLPTASAISPTLACTGGNLTFTNTSTGATAYNWSGPSSFSSTLANPTITNLTSANTGTYTLNAVSAAGCSKSTTLAVTVNASPSLTLTPVTSTVCAGNTVSITSAGANTYTWIPGSLNGSAHTFTPAATTVYTVSGTNAAGCVGTGTSAVTVNALPPVVLSPITTSICVGGSSTLTATGATTYSWSSGPVTGSVSVSPAATTVYTVTGTGSNGCSVIKTATVTVNTNPVALATANSTVCNGSSITFTNNSTGASSYSWSGPFSYTSTASAPVIANASNAQTGTYTLTAFNAAGCSASTTLSVSVNAIPAINTSISGSPACAGNTVTVGASGVGIVSYTWQPGSLVGAAQTYTVTSGINFTVSGTDASGCIGVNTVTANVNPLTAISGTVTNSSNPVAGKVILYQYEPFLTRFDSVTIQTLSGSGAYSFTSVPAGNYIVKAIPSASTLQVTYGSSAISWQNALVINHGCVTNTNQNIAVVALSNIGTGPGSLSGTITQTVGFGHRPISAYSPLSPGSPIGGIVVKGGKNPGGSMFAQTTTGANGTYTLSGLPTNAAGESYFILVDIPGLDTNHTYHEVITLTNNQFTGLDFTVDSIRVNPILSNATGIKNLAHDANHLIAYPNPASNKVIIQYTLQNPSLVSIEMMDVVGKTAKSVLPPAELNADTYSMPVMLDDLKPGIYFIKVKINASENVLRLMITN